jgi:hypothetical protein
MPALDRKMSELASLSCSGDPLDRARARLILCLYFLALHKAMQDLTDLMRRYRQPTYLIQSGTMQKLRSSYVTGKDLL